MFIGTIKTETFCLPEDCDNEDIYSQLSLLYLAIIPSNPD